MLNPFKKQEVQVFGSVVVVVDDRLEVLPIEGEEEGRIKAGDLILPINNGKEYFSRDGERFIVYNLELPALVEAQTLAKIRESEVIKGLFETPEPKRFMDYLPLIVLGLVTILTIIVRR